jgi:Zn-finger nucleic acid-binding protein
MLTHPKCPRCREIELTPVSAGATTLDRCSRCRGLWFDAKGDGLEKVLRLGWERVPVALKQPGPVTDPERRHYRWRSWGGPRPCRPQDVNSLSSWKYPSQVFDF